MRNKWTGYLRRAAVLAMAVGLSGCMEWLHAYQTYLQMSEFDRYFSISVTDDFTVHFKQPKLLSEDFVALGKLHASREEATPYGKTWRYLFRKVDKANEVVSPEVRFYFDLSFDKLDRIIDWTFSPLFLQIAPPEFLEASFRSLGGAEINEGKQQLKAKAELVEKISADLPKKSVVLQHLGEPLEITEEDHQQVYFYKFRLDTHDVEEGYEDRAMSELKLSFDKNSQELVKMSGRFAGLKISIDYRDFKEGGEKTAAGEPDPV